MDYTPRCLSKSFPSFKSLPVRIGEIVQQTGVSRDTIRYYERLGLLAADGRPAKANNYKAYPAATVTRLGLIQQAKKLGFTLAEIGDGLHLLDDAQLSDTVAEVRLTEQLAVIEDKMRALEAMRNSLLFLREQIQTGRCSLQAPLVERSTNPPNLLALFAKRT